MGGRHEQTFLQKILHVENRHMIKNAPHHSLSGKYKTKQNPQWDTISHLSEWLKWTRPLAPARVLEIKERLELPGGEASWLNGLDGHNDKGLVFAISMPDHSIHLVLWKEHGWCHALAAGDCGCWGSRVSVRPLAADCMNQSSHLMVAQCTIIYLCLPGGQSSGGGGLVFLTHSTAC